MKRGTYYFQILLCCICLMTDSTSAQWREIPYTTTLTENRSVAFINADTGFIAASSARILRTTNGGNQWNSTQLMHAVRSVSAAGNGTVFAGGDAIYRTTNAGLTWDSIYAQSKKSEQQTHVIAFIDEMRGCVSGTHLPIECTTDGGSNWVEGVHHQYQLPRSLNCAFFVNGRIAYFGGQMFTDMSGLLKTEDYGATWKDVLWDRGYRTPMSVKTVFFADELTGWIGGGNNALFDSRARYRVLHTTDGGDTWDTTNFKFPYTVNTIAFSNRYVGFVGDDGGNIFVTIDGGTTWKNDSAPSNGRSINSIVVAGGTAVYAVGDGGLILKRDIPTSVNEEHVAVGVDIFPNPSSGRVRIRINNYVGEAVVTINDVLGREVYAATLQQNDADVDLGSLPRGMYTVNLLSSIGFGKRSRKNFLWSGSICLVE